MADCQFDNCERIFVKLSLYWRSALFGFLTLLTVSSGVWAWSWKEFKDSQIAQNIAITEIRESLNDIANLQVQIKEISDGQKQMLRYLEQRR